MLIQNKKIIKKLNYGLSKRLDNFSTLLDVVKIDAKNGSPTLIVNRNEKELFLHSSYNPENEAYTIANTINSKEGSPLIFVGVGLGYHLPIILRKIKPKFFYLIELDPFILNETLNTVNLEDPIYSDLMGISLATTIEEIKSSILEIIEKSPEVPELVVLPSYQRIFKEEIDLVYNFYQQKITNVYDQLAAEFSFQSLWGINSVANLPIILKTPNLFLDIELEQFRDKPAIIVGAGPSLVHEIDNLKKIQKDQSAYIFSVGSAINALIEYNIKPHAVIAYDPKVQSKRAFEKIKDLNISNIPLVFGTTIGTAALNDYPGEKVHFFTSQDFFNPLLLLDSGYTNIIVNDAPSVTVVTLELLNKLQCSPIVLVGQNLSFQNNVRYAKGINYKPDPSMKTIEPNKTYFVESVNGEQLSSSKEYILIKNNIELFLEKHSHLKVINSTKNGAKIHYTTYNNLEDIMLEFIPNNVTKSIKINVRNNYNKIKVNQKLREYTEESVNFSILIRNVVLLLQNIEKYRQKKNVVKLNQLFSKLDSEIHKIMSLTYFNSLIKPMTRTYFEKTSREIQLINQKKEVLEKADDIIIHFTNLIKLWNFTNNNVSTMLKNYE